MGLRETKARMRADLHQAMRVRALYTPPGPDPVSVTCFVRVHTKSVLLGDQKGTNLNSAEQEAVAPRLVFWREELVPARNGVVTIRAEDTGSGEPEAYRVGVVLPPDNVTITARVAELNGSQMEDLIFEDPSEAP